MQTDEKLLSDRLADLDREITKAHRMYRILDSVLIALALLAALIIVFSLPIIGGYTL